MNCLSGIIYVTPIWHRLSTNLRLPNHTKIVMLNWFLWACPFNDILNISFSWLKKIVLVNVYLGSIWSIKLRIGLLFIRHFTLSKESIPGSTNPTVRLQGVVKSLTAMFYKCLIFDEASPNGAYETYWLIM